MKELNIVATVENIETVTDFVNEQLEALDCPMKAQMQIDIAIDELFGNIAHYAYNPDVGEATLRVEVIEDPLAVVITFIDKGVPYDPLAKADPNTTLSAEEREIGGLGIFMVKKNYGRDHLRIQGRTEYFSDQEIAKINAKCKNNLHLLCTLHLNKFSGGKIYEFPIIQKKERGQSFLARAAQRIHTSSQSRRVDGACGNRSSACRRGGLGLYRTPRYHTPHCCRL